RAPRHTARARLSSQPNLPHRRTPGGDAPYPCFVRAPPGMVQSSSGDHPRLAPPALRRFSQSTSSDHGSSPVLPGRPAVHADGTSSPGSFLGSRDRGAVTALVRSVPERDTPILAAVGQKL